ncbi:MAG: hypothetical protein R6X13_12130, partial [bacterium]
MGTRAWAVAFDPANANRIYVGGDSAYSYAALAISTDCGATWAQSRSGLSGAVNALAVNPDNGQFVYAGTASGLFRSTNAGATWAATALTRNTRAIAIDESNSSVVYAGTYGYGVQRSTDGGLTWTDFSVGLANNKVLSLAIREGGTTMMAGTEGGSVFRIDIVPAAANVGATHLLAPAGTLIQGAVVTPACSVYNYGSAAQDYRVRMRIGTGYNDTALVTGHAPGTRRYVTFPGWTAAELGSLAVTCSTELAGDAQPANDRRTGAVMVSNVDVGCTRLLAPAGMVHVGSAVTPACSVYNYGNQPITYQVRMRIGTGYDRNVTVTDHAPGVGLRVAFSNWTATPVGNYAVTCSTMAAGDLNVANDRQNGAVEVTAGDVGVSEIIEPAGVVAPGALVTPRIRVRNFSVEDAVCGARFTIRDAGSSVVYSMAIGNIAVAGGGTIEAEFPGWTANPAGNYTTETWTFMTGDHDPSNDTATGRFSVGGAAGGGWVEVTQVPLAPSGKMVKDGGWITWDALTGKYYVSKGYKASDFYSFEPVTRAWTELAAWPLGVEAKPPYKGAVGVSDGNGTIYAVKGNNKRGFWKFTADDSLGTWTQLEDVPLGLSNKNIKGGTDLAYVASDSGGFVYLLKGYKAEFYRYSVAGGTWQTLADAPTGVKDKYDKGSWLVHDPAGNRLFAHKAKYHELYAFDLATSTWGPLMPGIPLANQQTGKNKKAKDGSDAVLLDGVIWALKGGNTQDFYAYDIATSTWAEKET